MHGGIVIALYYQIQSFFLIKEGNRPIVHLFVPTPHKISANPMMCFLIVLIICLLRKYLLTVICQILF